MPTQMKSDLQTGSPVNILNIIQLEAMEAMLSYKGRFLKIGILFYSLYLWKGVGRWTSIFLHFWQERLPSWL